MGVIAALPYAVGILTEEIRRIVRQEIDRQFADIEKRVRALIAAEDRARKAAIEAAVKHEEGLKHG